MNLIHSGDSVTGFLVVARTTVEIEDGRFKNKSLTFNCKIQGNTLYFTLPVKNNSELAGKVTSTESQYSNRFFQASARRIQESNEESD